MKGVPWWVLIAVGSLFSLLWGWELHLRLARAYRFVYGAVAHRAVDFTVHIDQSQLSAPHGLEGRLVPEHCQ